MMRRLALLMLLAAPVAAAPTLVDKVHGYTLTGGGLQKFTAIAFDGGRILETGAERDLKAQYPNARIIDAHGATMLPGLIDAHGHIIDFGLGMARVALEDTHSLAEALTHIRKRPGYWAAAGTNSCGTCSAFPPRPSSMRLSPTDLFASTGSMITRSG